MYHWLTNIRYVRGIGPVKAQELNGMGINTVGDLLERQPLHYIFPGVTPIRDAKEGHVIVKGMITAITRLPSRVPIVEATLRDATGGCKARWYNQTYALQNLRVGMTVTMWGRFKGGVLQQPRFSTCGLDTGGVTGGYYGAHNETVRMALREVFRDVEIKDWVGRISRPGAFEFLHFPKDKAEQKAGLNRLKFDELFLMQLAMLKKRMRQEWYGSPTFFGCKPITNRPKILSYFPYEFTTEQEKAVKEITTDMCGNKPMSRLLHGEVSSGKTAVAFYAAMLAALNNKRTLILCPTTILAQQHWDTLWNMGWEDVALYCAGEEKQSADWYKANIIIGTHALLNNEQLLESASLVIIDEFQKFGVEQRAQATKHHPHLLLMSATPIPRSLAMTVFGDLDVSTIRELPIKRGTVITRWVLPDKRKGMYEIVKQELAKGKQTYVVYPRIGDDEQEQSARAGFIELCVIRFPHRSVHMLIGRFSTEDKAKTLRAFKQGKTDILVSTIIAEVGLDNPNASVMIIEGADRFGLSQLHQLRGRVCRSTDTAFCFLVSETANPTSIARLDVIEKCNDGFEIAEHDLRLRGPGEMFSTRQHGLPDLKFASLIDDYDLLMEARDLAQEYIHKLDDPANAGLKEMLKIKYGDTIKFGSVT